MRLRRLVPFLVLLHVGAGVSLSEAPWKTIPFRETIRYQWRLTGLAGAVIGLFYPRSGDAVLSAQAESSAGVTTVLEVTSPSRGPDEYYRYGAETDWEARPSRMWTSYNFKGKSKERQAEIGDGTRELASGIQFVRLHRPGEPTELRLWSDEKRYRVVVQPLGEETLRLGDRQVTASGYRIEDAHRGDEPRFRPHFEIWLLDDATATPARIVGHRGPLRIQLDLVQSEESALAAHSPLR